jgi:hypothetical protein
VLLVLLVLLVRLVLVLRLRLRLLLLLCVIFVTASLPDLERHDAGLPKQARDRQQLEQPFCF